MRSLDFSSSMKLYLGWWYNADLGEQIVLSMHRIIQNIFLEIGTKQILHIPFARTWIRKKNRGWFTPTIFAPYVQSLWIEYLNAEYLEDIEAFTWDTIYINGWNDTEFLMSTLQSDALKEVIWTARAIVGESAGAMVWGSYFHNNRSNGRTAWLWYLSNTIVVPHFSERWWLKKLHNGMRATGTSHWLWIDECTFVSYQDGQYWKTLWQWTIYLC